MPTVLLVEDDPLIVEFTRLNLSTDGFTVMEAGSARGALLAARCAPPDIIVLDIGLPGPDGLELCRTLRSGRGDLDPVLANRLATIPIIILTAHVRDEDKLKGFGAGADDYVTKPFNPAELAARIRAVLRRYGKGERATMLRVRSLIIDPEAHSICAGEQPLDLTLTEFELLHWLAQHPNYVFSRDELLQQVWKYKTGGDTRTVDVHVNRLRAKLAGLPGCDDLIVTERGLGYKLAP